jgi:AAA domain
VVVLARKVLACFGDSNSLNVALVGDKDELLADRPDEIAGKFVRGYLPQMLLKWENVQQPHLSNRKFVYSDYERDTCHLLSQMKMKLKTTDLHDVEERLDDVRDAVEEMKNAPQHENELAKKNFSEVINAVTHSVKNLSDDQVVRDLLDSADVVFCTLVASGSMPIIQTGNVSALIVDEASACTEPVGFLKDNRRLNVAFTRSKFQLVCVSNLGALCAFDDVGGHLTLRDIALNDNSRPRVSIP